MRMSRNWKILIVVSLIIDLLIGAAVYINYAENDVMWNSMERMATSMVLSHKNIRARLNGE